MKLRIGHLTYTVRAYTRKDQGVSRNYGLTNTLSQEILLDAGASSERQLEVLLHEIVHAAWGAYGMPPAAEEEQTAEFTGNAFAAVFLNNPHLLPVLTALCNGGTFLEQPK